MEWKDKCQLLVWLFNEGEQGTLAERPGILSLSPQFKGTEVWGLEMIRGGVLKSFHSHSFWKTPKHILYNLLCHFLSLHWFPSFKFRTYH